MHRPDNSFSDKTILITGCSSGIGFGVAKGLKQRGYKVFATARKLDDVEKLKADGFCSLQLDLRDSGSINRALEQILAQTNGKLYALFNNGAYAQAGAVEDLSRSVLKKQFETNVFGWLELTNLVIPVMRAQGYGRIIQNSSILGFMPLKFRGAYNASKYAIEGLSDTLRLELYDTNIFISLVEPGPIASRIRENSVPHFLNNIDRENSVYREFYRHWLERLKKTGPVSRFTLTPEAVLKKVIHALESKYPKPRYRVTVPTHLFWYLKRFLSTRMLDRILNKS